MDKGLRSVLGFNLSAQAHLPPSTSFQPGHRKKQSQTQAPGVSTPIPSPAPTVSTPTLQAAMPGITTPQALQRGIPTLQETVVPSVTAQLTLAQLSPLVSSAANGLPFDGALAQIPGASPQTAPQAPTSSPQQTIPCSRLPTLPEDRFKTLFAQFACTTGLRLNDRDFIIDGRPVNPWTLHRIVFACNGFDLVCLLYP